MASILTWNWSSSMDGPTGPQNQNALAQSDRSSARAAAARLLAASGKEDFFGIPIGTGSVGLVIDDHDRLSGYTHQVARLAYAASDFARSNGTALSVVEARLRGAGGGDAESDPFYAMSVLRIQASRQRLDSQEPQQSYLSTAVSMTAPLAPSQLFLVISEPLTNNELGQLETAVRAAGVPVHMICLGAAANKPYDAMAKITGGKFIPVTDQAIEDLVDRCDVTMPARR